ncbi:MAG TPA: transcription repressor NadR [Firmicutes bacterium]|nr:transcription repressor NadR [Bacillota bacterium]
MAVERRRRILELLRRAREPVTGSELARRFGVSRQVIVQDIAVLRAAGEEVVATPQGYRLGSGSPVGPYRAVLAVRHRPEQTQDELNTLVDCGLRVLDVVVEHPLYGELRGLLLLASRQDVATFVDQVTRTGAGLLSTLTGGVHLHTVEAPHPDALLCAREALRARGYLLEDS